MDPSSNNNSPQYYPPPQQDYPPANPYQSPQQYPPTQQGNPPVNPYPQQGYPPVDPYQYDQQEPQIPNSTQNLDQLGRGWFQCYKFALVSAVLFGIFELISAPAFFMTGRGYSSILYGLLQGICGPCLMALVVLQFLAMKNKDLKKAKIALIGFLGYVPFSLFLPFAFYLFTPKFPIQSAAAGAGYLMIYDAFILIGSFKVYQLLNTNQVKFEYDNYQNQNYDTA